MEIIIQPPVYTPFHGAAKDHERILVYNNLLETAEGWVMDFDGLRKLISPVSENDNNIQSSQPGRTRMAEGRTGGACRYLLPERD